MICEVCGLVMTETQTMIVPGAPGVADPLMPLGACHEVCWHQRWQEIYGQTHRFKVISTREELHKGEA